MRREDNFSYNFGDPYYTGSAYGAGYDYNNGSYAPDWSCPGGWGSGTGYGPGFGYGNGGFGPGMGYDPSQWGSGYYQPGYPGSAPWDELLQLARDTNQCCRRMMEMMQSMHNNNYGNMMSEE